MEQVPWEQELQPQRSEHQPHMCSILAKIACCQVSQASCSLQFCPGEAAELADMVPLLPLALLLWPPSHPLFSLCSLLAVTPLVLPPLYCKTCQICSKLESLVWWTLIYQPPDSAMNILLTLLCHILLHLPISLFSYQHILFLGCKLQTSVHFTLNISLYIDFN